MYEAIHNLQHEPVQETVQTHGFHKVQVGGRERGGGRPLTITGGSHRVLVFGLFMLSACLFFDLFVCKY